MSKVTQVQKSKPNLKQTKWKELIVNFKRKIGKGVKVVKLKNNFEQEKKANYHIYARFVNLLGKLRNDKTFLVVEKSYLFSFKISQTRTEFILLLS